MKLYTEEQVKQMFENLNTATGYDYSMETYCDSLTPIELPSDDDIDIATPTITKNDYNIGFMYGFESGAMWLKQKILNQNK